MRVLPQSPLLIVSVEGPIGKSIRNVEKLTSLFEVITTDPLERQMVEVNKRFENGGTWTQNGARALFWHYQQWLINLEKWLNQLLPDEESPMSDFLQNPLICRSA